MLQNATDVMFESVIFQGKPALFTDGRLDKTTLPAGIYCYDIRHSDNDWGKPCTLENHVLVNFFGSIITKEPISLSSEGYLRMKPRMLDFSDAQPARMADFLSKPEKQLSITERLQAIHKARHDQPKPQKKPPIKGKEERS